MSALQSLKSMKFTPLKDQSIELSLKNNDDPDGLVSEPSEIEPLLPKRRCTIRRCVCLIVMLIMLTTIVGFLMIYDRHPEQPIFQSYDLHRDPSIWPTPSLKSSYVEDRPLTYWHRYNVKSIIAPDRYPRNTFTFIKSNDTNRLGSSSFLERGGIIMAKNKRTTLLCNIADDKNCRSYEIAEYTDTVYVLCPIYSTNQSLFPVLYTHHSNFVAYMRSFGLKAVELEAVYPGQDYKLTTAGNEPWQFQLEINDTFYYRENFLNVLARKLKGWEYLFWIDAHQTFVNSYFWEEAIRGMEVYATVQLAQTMGHTDPHNTSDPNQKNPGALYGYTTTKELDKYIDWTRFWLGNCLGIRKEIYDKIGTIIDTCIGGHCDTAYDYATMTDYWGKMAGTGHYYTQLEPWISNARKYMGGNGGVVRGHMMHIYHEHHFPWGKVLDKLESEKYSLTDHLYRDENFTLHIKENTSMLDVFPRYNTSSSLLNVPMILIIILAYSSF